MRFSVRSFLSRGALPLAMAVSLGFLAGGCPEGGILPGDDAAPPQRDSAVDAAPDGEVDPCGDGVCDEAGGEDCTTCELDCLGIACSPVRDVTVQQYREDLLHEIGGTVIDMRDQVECENARIPGDTFCSTVSDWWDGAAITDNGGFLDWATMSLHNPLTFYGDGSDDDGVLAAAEAAWELGYDNLYRIVGGISAWRSEGWYQDISREGLLRLYYPAGPDVYLIDTMDATAYESCHIQDATSLDTYSFYYNGQLLDNGQPLLDLAPDLDSSVLIFFCINRACVASEEASVAAELIGYQHIFHYKEGTEDWYCPPSNGPVEGTGCSDIICSP